VTSVDIANRGSEDIDTVARAIAAKSTVDEAIDVLLGEARRLTRAEAGTVFVRDSERLRFACVQNDVLAARWGAEEAQRKLAAEPLRLSRSSIAGYAALMRAVVNLADVYDIPAARPYTFDERFDQKVDYRTRSMLAVPLRDHGRLAFGVLQLINARSADGEVIPFPTGAQDLIVRLVAKISPRLAALMTRLG
jgi:GAF domain-containing protein